MKKRKPGRPPLAGTRRYHRLAEPRWTRMEAALIRSRSDKLGLSVSAYIRQAAMSYQP